MVGVVGVFDRYAGCVIFCEECCPNLVICTFWWCGSEAWVWHSLVSKGVKCCWC